MTDKQTSQIKHNCNGHAEMGVGFIIVGTLFLLKTFNILPFEWHWYFYAIAVFVGIGIVQIVQLHKPRKIVEGVISLVMAAWFYLSFSGVWGLSPTTTWPIVLILGGLSIMLQSQSKQTTKNNDKCQ